MNHDELTQRTAEYLGDEMDAAARMRFEQAMAADPALAREVAGLRSALEAMRSLDAAAPSPIALRPSGRWRTAALAALRYAAVIAVGFAAGYALRPSPPADLNNPPERAAISDGAGADARLARLAEAYISQRSDSSLARSLLAISQIHAAPHQ
jgi:ferric-dicitrate binding protein FerR (iron transport regulator)